MSSRSQKAVAKEGTPAGMETRPKAGSNPTRAPGCDCASQRYRADDRMRLAINDEAPRTDPDEEFRTQVLKALPKLHAFARVLTRNREQAEDLVHDSVVRALRAQSSFVAGTNMVAWLCTILRNQHISGLRRRKFEALPIDDMSAALGSVGPDQYHSVELKEIRRALLKLSPQHREVVLLVAVTGLGYGEVAEICGCPVGTVKSRLNRARADLRRMLADRSGDVASDVEQENTEERAAA
jgi:RNA polymerase sigma-70 factor (ECF subfamily)